MNDNINEHVLKTEINLSSQLKPMIMNMQIKYPSSQQQNGIQQYYELFAGNNTDDQLVAQRFIDITFLTIYNNITALIMLMASYRTLRLKENRTLSNTLTITFIFLTISIRLAVFIYSLVNPDESHQDFYMKDQIVDYFYFEIPFDFIITASIVQFFNWLQFCVFLYKSGDEAQKVYTQKGYKIGMLICVSISITALLLKLVAVALVSTIGDSFLNVNDCILFGIYCITTFSFIPLFIAIMSKLKLNYPHLFIEIKYKLISIFLIFIVFLTARLYLYADIKKLKKIFENPNIYGVIPFYSSEIVITIALSYVLFAVSRMERRSTTLQNRKSINNTSHNQSSNMDKRLSDQTITQTFLTNNDQSYYMGKYGMQNNNQGYALSGDFADDMKDSGFGVINKSMNETITKQRVLSHENGRKISDFQESNKADKNACIQNTDQSQKLKNNSKKQNQYQVIDTSKNSQVSINSYEQFEPKTIEIEDDEENHLHSQESSSNLYNDYDKNQYHDIENNDIYRETQHNQKFQQKLGKQQSNQYMNKKYEMDPPILSPKSHYRESLMDVGSMQFNYNYSQAQSIMIYLMILVYYYNSLQILNSLQEQQVVAEKQIIVRIRIKRKQLIILIGKQGKLKQI